MLKQYRQGDVLLECVPAGPSGLLMPVPPEGGRYVIRLGEATGHAHTFDQAQVRSAVRDAAGELWFDLEPGATALHEEHDPVEFPAGGWHRDRMQREYSPQAIRNVAD